MLTFLNYQEEIIGRGLQVPNSFDTTTGRTISNSGVERINQSIYHILSTRIGTRFFIPEFGSNLYKLVFEPNDYILKDLLIRYIAEALDRWEPRINNLTVAPDLEKHENIVPVYLTYTLINTNVQGNYVYPFNREIYDPQSIDVTHTSLI